MGEHAVKGNIFIEGDHCGKGRDLNGERIYNGVGGFLIVGANYFPPPSGFLPLKSRRRETFNAKYSPRWRNFTGKYSPGETFFGGDPIMAHRLQCWWHRGGKYRCANLVSSRQWCTTAQPPRPSSAQTVQTVNNNTTHCGCSRHLSPACSDAAGPSELLVMSI